MRSSRETRTRFAHAGQLIYCATLIKYLGPYSKSRSRAPPFCRKEFKVDYVLFYLGIAFLHSPGTATGGRTQISRAGRVGPQIVLVWAADLLPVRSTIWVNSAPPLAGDYFVDSLRLSVAAAWPWCRGVSGTFPCKSRVLKQFGSQQGNAPPRHRVCIFQLVQYVRPLASHEARLGFSDLHALRLWRNAVFSAGRVDFRLCCFGSRPGFLPLP